MKIGDKCWVSCTRQALHNYIYDVFYVIVYVQDINYPVQNVKL